MSNYPFYYKVKFHLLTRDKENNLKFHDTEKEFSNPDPYRARQEAFEEFEEYLKFLKDSNKLTEDEVGNFKIISPSDIPDKPEVSKVDDDLYGRIHNWTDFMKFREEIEVLLVINDDDLMDEIGYGDRVFTLHSVASYSIDQEQILENLELIELQVYKTMNISIEDQIKTVEYFGDYYDSGKSESSSSWDILPTPQKWQTLEQFKALIKEDDNAPESLTFDEIIAGGENNTLELKSSLVYNFSADLANWRPFFNNARTICGFLNANGGLLIIGVTDDGTPQGIDKDLELLGNKDKVRLKVDDLMSTYFNNTIASLIDVSFETVAGKEILIIAVKQSKTPVFLKNYNYNTKITTKQFFIRRSASTTELKDVEEMITYIFNHGYHSGN